MKQSNAIDFMTVGELLMEVEKIANEWFDGHYCVFSFTSNYGGCYGTPTPDCEIIDLPKHPSLVKLVKDMALYPMSYRLWHNLDKRPKGYGE